MRIIFGKLKELKNNQDNLDIKKMNPKELDIYRLRVWKFRLIFDYQDKDIRLVPK